MHSSPEADMTYAVGRLSGLLTRIPGFRPSMDGIVAQYLLSFRYACFPYQIAAACNPA